MLISCERSVQYKCRKKEFVRRDTGSRKCGCSFKLRGKPVIGGQGWMVKLICGIHNHELAKSRLFIYSADVFYSTNLEEFFKAIFYFIDLIDTLINNGILLRPFNNLLSYCSKASI